MFGERIAGREPVRSRGGPHPPGGAADVNWIAQNVRWDPAADAERFFGPTLAEAVSRANEQFSQVGEKVKNAMGQLFDQFQARKKS